MVIYQKQHRLAHRQYCVLLSESRLTRFPPPSKKAFFPSSHIFRVNIKCIIKTLFSSKCGSINFRSSLQWQTPGGMKRSPHPSVAPSRSLRSRGAKPQRRQPEEVVGGSLRAGGHSETSLRSQPAPPRPDPVSTSRSTPRHAERRGRGLGFVSDPETGKRSGK